MASPIVRELLDAGIHFGHHASRWNPKMGPYIYGKRNSIHIIDIRETLRGLLRAQKFLTRVVSNNEDVLFVGTKRQARDAVISQAQRTGMPFVTERWLGGTLTNFRTIRSRLQRLEELEALSTSPQWETGYSKKMRSQLSRELRKIKRNLDGMRVMTRLPGALVVVDVRKEVNALREAHALGIPTICIIDTDSDPDFASIPIPANDDAMRGIQIMLTKLCDAIEEGKRSRPEPRQADMGEGGEFGAGGPRRGGRRRGAAGGERGGYGGAATATMPESAPAPAPEASAPASEPGPAPAEQGESAG